MTLLELVAEAHGTAKEKGWWEPGKEKTPLEAHMLMVSEIAEATEAVRNKKPPFYLLATISDMTQASNMGKPMGEVVEFRPLGDKPTFPALKGCFEAAFAAGFKVKDLKPEGEAVELVDAVIRIADWFGWKDWDLSFIVAAKMDYNNTREYRHGNKTA